MKHLAIVALTAVASQAGCTNLPKNMPLVFGESITVGISIGATTADQGADFTVGFKSRDVAVIPVVAYESDDSVTQIHSTVEKTTSDVEESRSEETTDKTSGNKTTASIISTTPKSVHINKDAYSVLGQFGSTTDGAGRRVGLGKFFATGWAAQKLSDGFSACLKNNSCGDARASEQEQ